MLDKFKQMKNLYEIQKQLAQEKVEVEVDGNTMTMNGKMEILELNISDETFQSGKSAVEEVMKNLHAKAMKEVQQVMASKMGGLGGIM